MDRTYDLDQVLAEIRAERAGQPAPQRRKPRPSRAKAVRPRGGVVDRAGLKAAAGRYNALKARRGEGDPETVAARSAWRRLGALDAVEQWAERPLSDAEQAAVLAVLWPESAADGVTTVADGVTSPTDC